MSTPMFKYFIVSALLLCIFQARSQGVGIGVENPNSNAVLELVSPNNNQGLLIPKMTTAQRINPDFVNNLTENENGLLVYDSDNNAFYFWMNSGWVAMQMNISIVAGAGIEILDGEISNTGDLDPLNEIQNLAIIGTNLTISGGNTIDLSGIDTDTDDQAATEVPVTPAGGVTSTNVQMHSRNFKVKLFQPGGGDMLASSYDTDGDLEVNAAENANTVNGLTVETAVPSERYLPMTKRSGLMEPTCPLKMETALTSASSIQTQMTRL